MAVLRSLVTSLSMNSSNYRAELKRTGRDTENFHRNIKKGADSSVASYAAIARQAASTGALMATAAAASMVAIGKQTEELLRLSEQSRMGFEDFQALTHATRQYGIEAEKMADISKDVTDKLGDFLATGGGPFADFFENVAPKVGLTAESLKGLSGPEVLQAVKNAMDQANVSMEEQVFYLEAIGNDASRLMPLLANNGQLQRELATEFERSNKAISQQDAKKLRQMNIAFDNMATSAATAAATITAKLSPAIIGLSNILEQAFAPEDATAKIEASLASLDAGIAAKKAEIQALQDMTVQQAYKATGTSYGLKTQAGLEAQKNTALAAENRKLDALIQQRADLQAQLDALNKPVVPIEQPPALIPPQVEEPKKPPGGLTPEEIARQTELNQQWLLQLQQRMMDEEALINAREQQEIARAEKEILNAETRKQALVLIEQNKTKEMAALRQREANQLAQINQQEVAARSLMLGEMAGLVGAFAGEQSGIYKAMFAASKAYNIATTLSAAFPAIQQAWASAPFPHNLPAVASTTASTGALSAAAQAVQLTGIAHNGLTDIPTTGTWLLNEGERVLSSRQNTDLTSYLDGKQKQPIWNVNVFDAPPETTVNVDQQAQTVNIAVARAKSEINADIERGGNETANNLETVYGLNRAWGI